MASTIVSLALALAAGTSAWSGGPAVCNNPNHHHQSGGRILSDGPGYGRGFANGNPDGYGWFDVGDSLPLGGNRTAEYYFPRFYAIPPTQMFMQSYYNPYLTRGQRYVPYTGQGGDHPAGGIPMGSANLPVNPYNDTLGNGPRMTLPRFSGRVEAAPINSGATGLTP